MRRWMISLLFIALARQPAVAGMAELAPLADRDAAAVVLIDDLSRTIDGMKANPLVHAWEDGDVRWAFSGLRQAWRVDMWQKLARTELGYSLDELQAALAGPAMLVATLSTDSEVAGALLLRSGLVAKAADADALEALIRYQLETSVWRERGDPHHELASEPYRGVTLYWRRTAPGEESGPTAFRPGYARVGDYLVVAEPVEYLKQLVGNIQEGASVQPWIESPAARELLQRHRQADLLFTLEAEGIAHLLDDVFRYDLPEQSELTEEQRQVLEEANREVQKMLAGLELDNISALSGAVQLGAEKSELAAEMSYREERGIVSLLAYEPGPVSLPAFLPEGLTSAETLRFDLPHFWSALQALGESVLPLQAMTTQLQLQFQALAQKHGVDVEKTLLGGVGQEVVWGSFPILLEMEERPKPVELDGLFLAVALDDEQGVAGVIDTLMAEYGLAANYDSLDYMDTRIRVQRDNQVGDYALPSRAAYTVTDGYLLYAADLPILQQAVARLRHPDHYRAALDGTPLGEGIAAFPGRASSIGFYTPESVMDGLFDQLLDYQRKLASSGSGSCSPRIELEPGSLDGFVDGLVSATYKEPGRLFTRMRLLHHDAD